MILNPEYNGFNLLYYPMSLFYHTPSLLTLPLFPQLRSQITHQSHFISLAQTAHQSGGRMGRNTTVDWLVGGVRGGAAQPSPNNSSVL